VTYGGRSNQTKMIYGFIQAIDEIFFPGFFVRLPSWSNREFSLVAAGYPALTRLVPGKLTVEVERNSLRLKEVDPVCYFK